MILSVPPTINGSDERRDILVTLNEPVELSCPAEGTPLPGVTWYRKGHAVPSYGAPNLKIQDNGHTMVIMSAQLRDFGDYSCQAVSAAGQAQKNFRLTVQGKRLW